MQRILGLSLLLFSASTLWARDDSTECLGSPDAKGQLVYLHGLTPPNQETPEEGENRKALEQLARDLSLRIALPRAPLCPTGKHCWPAGDATEVLKTFEMIREKAKTCWSGNPRYDLLGFSNGGYFAFKLYKVHKDPQLFRILATGSAGVWDKGTDRAHPDSRFFLMIGRQDITLKKAKQLAGILKKEIPGFRFETFPGGHRLDYRTSKVLLESR